MIKNDRYTVQNFLSHLINIIHNVKKMPQKLKIKCFDLGA